MKSFKNDFLKEQALKDYLDDRIAIETQARVDSDNLLNGRITDTETEIGLRQLISEKNQPNGYAGLNGSGNLTLGSDSIPEGTVNLYSTPARILATLLSGLNTALTGSVLDTDSILQAFGKIQNQIGAIQTSIGNVFSGKTTSDLAEGTNLYYTDARARTGVVDNAISNGIVNKAPSQASVFTALQGKQDTLVSGTSLKTLNGESLLGSGNVVTPQSTTDLAEGLNLYFTANRVRSTVLTGLDILLTGAISVSDSVLEAFGKIQNQINAIQTSVTNVFSGKTTSDLAEGINLYFTENRVRNSLLTALNTGLTGAILATDSILQAFGRLQNQINGILTSKQDSLVSGTTIKTLNGESLLGSGNISTPQNTSQLPELTNLYFTENRVRLTVLTGLNTLLTGAILATDSILNAFGKIQNQINGISTSKQDALVSGTSIKTLNGDSLLGPGNISIPIIANTDALSEGTSNLYFTVSRVRSAILTGLNTALTGAILATDSVLDAFGKIQNQIGAIQTSITNLFSGKTTDDLAEGPTNLYFSNLRARLAVVDDAIVDGITNRSPSQNAVFDALAGKQEVLVSGTNIKTINGVPVLGSGDIVISGGGGGPANTDALPEGTTNLYLTAPRVRSTILTGIDLLLTGAISATDSILQALGKLQNQISAIVPVSNAEKTLWNNTIFNAGNITGSVSFSGFNLNRTYKATLTGNTTFSAISGGVEGNVYLMIFTQDATGNRTLTLPANVLIPVGESIDLGISKRTVLSMYFDGTNYLGSFKKGW